MGMMIRSSMTCLSVLKSNGSVLKIHLTGHVYLSVWNKESSSSDNFTEAMAITYCVSIATVVAPAHLNVTLCVHCPMIKPDCASSNAQTLKGYSVAGNLTHLIMLCSQISLRTRNTRFVDFLQILSSNVTWSYLEELTSFSGGQDVFLHRTRSWAVHSCS